MQQPLADTLVVKVTNCQSAPVEGQRVDFVFVAGGTGSALVPNTTNTDKDGLAKAVWLLGNLAGQQRVEARVIGGGATSGLMQPFTATALADIADTILAVKGDSQSGIVNRALTDSLAVLVTDQYGNPVADDTVRWAVPNGQGSVSDAITVTGADGRAAVQRTLGPGSGEQTATAASTGLKGSPVTFVSTAVSGSVTQLVKLFGDGQTAPAGNRLTDSVVVQAQDALGNGVPGQSVVWVVTTGGGTSSGGNTVTDAEGKAFVFWTLGTTAGPNTMTAAIAALPQVQFTATGIAAQASRIASNSATSQNGTAGVAVAAPPSVKVTDINGNAVQGVTVKFKVATGGGAVSDGTGSGDSVTVATNSLGIATVVSWTLGNVAGPNSVSASATGTGGAALTGSPVTFNATGAVGAAAKLAFTVQPSNVVAGANITPAVQVTVQDAAGNTVSASTAAITIGIGSNPGTSTLGGTATVNAVAGVATFPNLTLNKVGTGYTLTASSGVLTAATSTAFNVTVGAASKLAFLVQPSSVGAGAAITPAVQVQVQDANGNPVLTSAAGITIAIGTNPGGSTLGGTVTLNAVAGTATFSNLTLNKVGTGYTLTAASTGLTGATSAAFNVVTAPGANIAVSAGNNQTATVGTAVPVPPAVLVTDAFGNPVAGVNVTFAVASGGGTVVPTTAIATNASGIATVTSWTLGTTAGTNNNTLTATSAGLTGSPVTFTASATAGTGSKLGFSVQPTNVVAGATIAPAVQVQMLDNSNNLVTTFNGSVTMAFGANPGTATLGGTITVNASNGVATFSTLTVNKVGTGYTLVASASGATSATSTTFNVTPGAASKVAFGVQPSNAVAGVAIAPAVTARVLDANDNLVTTSTATVTMAIGTNAGGGTLSGTASVAAVAGVATFSTLSINKSGTGYTLAAASTGLTGATSTAFNITFAAAATVTKTAGDNQTNITAGSPVPILPQVTVTDAFGNAVSGAAVTFAVASGGGSGGGATTTNALGVATAASWTTGTAAGTNTMTATVGALPVQTFTVTTIAGTGNKLLISTQPSAAVQSGVAFPVQPVIQLADINNNAVATAGVNVTVSIQTGGGGLNGTTTVQTDATGKATFSGLSISGLVGTRTLLFGAGGFAGVTSNNVVVSAGPAASIAVNAGNGQTATVNTAVATAPSVILRDASNNPVSGVNVTFAVASGGGTVNPTTAIATNASGIATVTSWTLGTTAGANSLTATATGSGIAGNPLTFTATGVAGAATQIAINGGNGQSAQAGTAVATAPSAIVRDAFNNPVAGVNVTFAVTGGGGSVVPTTAIATNASGIAQVTSWTLGNTVGANSLGATSTGLTGSPLTFTATGTAGAATKLAFGTQPANSTAGAAIPAFTVLIQDAAGNTVTTATNAVSIALGANPGASTLTGTLTVNAVNGVATFSTASLNKTGSGYTLTAGATGLTGATSSAFNVTPGAASKVVFAQQPTNEAAGAAISPAVTVQIQDANSNVVTTSTATVTIAIGTNPGGGTLTGTTSVAAVAGVATFSNLSINKTGAGYTLTAASTGLTGATSSAFDVTPGAASKVVFAQQPSNVAANASITPAVTVQIRDVNDNVVTTSTATVTVAIGTNPGGSALGGTTSIAAVAGVATFSNLSLNKVGTGYTLTAASSGLTGATSSSFNVTAGGATTIALNAGNGQTATAGAAVATAPSVLVTDAGGNPVSGVGVTFTVTGGGGSVLGGAATTNASGIAAVTSWTLGTTAGTNTLTATSGGLAGSPVTFTATGVAGTATKLAFSTQPTNVAAGSSITPAVQVAIQDANSNTVTTATTSITVAIGTNPGTSTLGGTATVAAVAGVATFSNLTLNKTGTGYTLTAAGTGLTGATSATFNVSAGAAATITKSAGDGQTATVGTAVPIDPAVLVTDANNNPVSGVNVTFAVASGGGTVVPTTAIATNASGIATVNSWTLGSVAGPNSLTATSAGLAGSPLTFTATGVSGTGSKLAITTQPSASVQSGVAFPVQPVIQLQDNLGNNVTTSGVIVTVSIQTGGGSLGGTTNATTTNGVATFTNLSISGTIGTRTLLFSAAGFTGVASNNVSVGPGLAAKLAFTAQPTSAVAGAAISPAVQVTIQDADGNTVTTATNTVGMAIGTNPSSGTLSGTTSVAAVSGVASFSNLSINNAGTGYTLAASSTGLTGATSSAFNISAAATTTTISSDTPDPSVTGQSTTVNFTVSGGTITPTGTVTVSDGTQSCNGTLTAGAGSCTIAFTTTGAKSLTGTYGGDGGHSGSTSAAAAHTVNSAATTTSITGDTPDPSTVNAAYTVNYTVAVSAPGAGTPTGNVTVSDGTSSCTGTAAAGTCSLTSTTTGSKTLTATYAGDGNFATSSGTTAHAVNSAATTTTISSDTPDPSVTGQSVTVNFSVTGGSTTPTGTVTVSDGTQSCNGALTAGAGSCSIAFSTTGAKSLTATYGGDATHGGSTSAAAAHTVNLAATTTTITGDTPDPSTVNAAYAVNYSVAVTAPGAGTPTGNVTVSDGAASCTASVAAGTCNLTSTSTGAKTLTATYAGDANFATSSGTTSHTVNASSTTTTITADTPDPSVVGQSVTISFSVTGGSSPTGTVTVSDGTQSCNGALSSGTGSCAISFTSAGAKTLTATYGGDGNNSGSTSAGAAHTVNAAATTTTITSDTPDPSTVNAAYAVNYSVAVTAPGAGTPTGNVTVSDGTASCTATVAAGTCNLTSTSTGAKTLTATYAGDGNFATSSGTTGHTVNAAATTTSITSDTPDPSVVGETVTINFSVTGGTTTPTGTVTVSDGTQSCNAALSSGTGSCTIAFASPGAKTLTATYGGDATHSGSTSAGAAHTVNQAATTTTITGHTPDPSAVGAPITVTFTVAANAPGSGTPTGNVTVSDGTNSCIATAAAGTCNLTPATGVATTITLTATYAGDTNFAGSTSASVTHTVQ